MGRRPRSLALLTLALLALALLAPALFPSVGAAEGNATGDPGSDGDPGDDPGDDTPTRATGLSSVVWFPLLLGVVALVVVLVALAYRGLP